MGVHVAESVADACRALASDPRSEVVAGGTDFMVEVQRGERNPSSIVAVGHLDELRSWQRTDGALRLGAGLTLASLAAEGLATLAPALADAARSAASPQVRNAGTLGGNLATAAPTGDLAPALLALGAVVHLRRSDGVRSSPIGAFLRGPRSTSLAAGELIEAVTIPTAQGPQSHQRVAARAAVAPALASVVVVVDLDARRVNVGIGAVGSHPQRAADAEAWVTAAIDWALPRVAEQDVVEFGARVAEEVTPVGDHRCSAAYRTHAVAVLARRGLREAFR